ncbi:MAG: hypothetical protein V3U76_11560 [Granulosicoccus sp.]
MNTSAVASVTLGSHAKALSMVDATQRQRGVGVLLLMLVLLVGAGSTALWLAASAEPLAAINTSMKHPWQDLIQARQALLAYTADYAQLYGGTSAGPGHLPCPDSDIRKPVKADSAAPNDGPNPPCGRGGFSTGWLPRQVTINAHRYVIQPQKSRNYRYTVATGYINNPINRIVNSRSNTGLSVGGRQAVVAMISTDKVVGDQGMQIFLYRGQLIKTAKRAVAAWLIEALQRAYLRSCRDESIGGSEGCRFTSTVLSRENSTQHEQYINLRGQDLVSVLADPVANSIDGTPILRHWFVRNRWHEEFELQVQQVCLGEYAGRCQFVIGTGVTADSETVAGQESSWAELTRIQLDMASVDAAGNSRVSRRINRIDWRPVVTSDR